MDRALDAKARLEAMKQPVPRPTRAALELNKKEVASRREPSMMTSVMGPFNKRPDMGRATRVGEPTMVDPAPVNATDVVRKATLAIGGGKGGADTKLGAQVVSVDPAANQEPPRSDTPPAAVADAAASAADPAVAAPPAEQPASQAEAPVAGELVPNVAADPNAATPNVAADPTALPPPQQNNELANGSPAASASSSSSAQKADDLVDISSSKKKKKKGMGKLNPF
jgi:outer membrane protein assembly factor BamD